jgi:hypothetical protein
MPAPAAPANSVFPVVEQALRRGSGISHAHPLRILGGSCLFGEPRHSPLQRLQVGQDQLGRDRLDVAFRRHLAIHVADVRVREHPDHLADRVGLADVGQELVAQALALGRAAHQARDVHEPDGGGDDPRGAAQPREHRQPRIGMPTMPTFGSMVAKG